MCGKLFCVTNSALLSGITGACRGNIVKNVELRSVASLDLDALRNMQCAFSYPCVGIDFPDRYI